MSKPILWIVIPCYNEEQVLPITAPMFLQKIHDLTAAGLVSDQSRVLFVNMTETMAREAIAQLEQFGITHVHWIPFYPGAELPGDVHIAVTPDEMRYVPEEIETKIDVGQRACTSGMMIEIALRLGLEHLLETEKFQTYFQSIATSNYSFDQMFARSIRLFPKPFIYPSVVVTEACPSPSEMISMGM